MKIICKWIICVAVAFVTAGCGVVPGAGRMNSDYQNIANYSLSGASKTKIRGDFGEPDQVREESGNEIWTYLNRQDGRTIEFAFDPKGKLVYTHFED